MRRSPGRRTPKRIALIALGVLLFLAISAGLARFLTTDNLEREKDVAWPVLGKLPVVQCIDVRRTGNALTGVHVTLLALSKPIDNEGNC